MRRRARSQGGFFGSDRFAEFARGLHYDVAESFAASRAHTAAEHFKFAVVPTLNGIDAFGTDAEAVRQVRERALDRWGSHDFWGNAYRIEQALQWCVAQLLDNGRCYLRVQYVGKRPTVAERIDFLAPETITQRTSGSQLFYEQYVSRHAFAGAAEQWHEFEPTEIVALEWPLDEPQGRRPPTLTAIHAGRHVEQLMERMHYGLRAGANPEDRSLPLVRARVGAYQDALEQVENAEDRVADMLFDVPLRNATEFFQLERLCRQREAASAVRDYLLGALNDQWLDRWCALNDWGRVELRFRAQLWSAGDWRELRADLLAGRASIADASAAFEIEREEIKRLDRD
jgi:hypothetical protein